jgi:hypothetical protein
MGSMILRRQLIGSALLALSIIVMPLARAAVKSVVIVHGAFADGSGWKPVSDILEHDGYTG